MTQLNDATGPRHKNRRLAHTRGTQTKLKAEATFILSSQTTMTSLLANQFPARRCLKMSYFICCDEIFVITLQLRQKVTTSLRSFCSFWVQRMAKMLHRCRGFQHVCKCNTSSACGRKNPEEKKDEEEEEKEEEEDEEQPISDCWKVCESFRLMRLAVVRLIC